MLNDKKSCIRYGRTTFSGCVLCAGRGGEEAKCANQAALAALAQYNAEHAIKNH